MWKIVIESSLTQYLHLALLSQKTQDCGEASGGSIWNQTSPFMLALNKHSYIFKTSWLAVSTLWTRAETLAMCVISARSCLVGGLLKLPDNNLHVIIFLWILHTDVREWCSSRVKRHNTMIHSPSWTAWKGLLGSIYFMEWVIFSLCKMSSLRLRSEIANWNTSSSRAAFSSKMAPAGTCR